MRTRKNKAKPSTIAELSAMGGRARWQKIGAADRSREMASVAKAGWKTRRANDLRLSCDTRNG